MDKLVHKLEFEGPSISITSRHLSVGVAAFNSTTFNGMTVGAFMDNTLEPQVAAGFPSERRTLAGSGST